MKRMFFLSLIALLFALPALALSEVKQGEKAPDFSLSTLQGEKISLSGLNGKVIVIGFVDTCEPCEMLAQELEKLRAEHQKNSQIVVLGIASEDKKGTEKMLKELNPKPQYPMLVDPKMSVYKKYGLRGEPIAIIVDSKGVIAFKSFVTKAEDLSKEVSKLLK